MASSRTDDAGFATPMAMTMSLALTVMVGALAAASSQELAFARRDLARSRAEYVLGGAHLKAALRLEGAVPSERYHWTEQTELGPAEIVAEAERAKPSDAAAADLGSAPLNALLDRPCKSSSAPLPEKVAGAPREAGGGQTLLGQVWRLRVSAAGWSDDRLVRFTGDGRRPAATITRRVTRSEPRGETCDAPRKTLAAAG